MELVRLSLIQNADECLGWVGDVVCRTGELGGNRIVSGATVAKE